MKKTEISKTEKSMSPKFHFLTRFVCCLLAALIFKTTALRGQNYAYRTYLNDNEIAGTIKHNFTTDTIRKYIGQFHDRLGYEYYLYQSVLKYPENKTIALRYLDTAFARGIDTLCLPPLIKQMFGDSIIHSSRSRNFLKAYDLRLKQQLDSLVTEDQKYRIIAFPKDKRKEFEDSINVIWKLTDSSNVLFLKALIKKRGYPTAKKIGYDFCTYKRTHPELIIQHLGTEQRDFQIVVLKKAIELCLKNEENWDKISTLQFNLHSRFFPSYSEFTFLYFKENKLDVENSLLSLAEMVKFLRSPFESLYIKCRLESVFNEIKIAMLDINERIQLPPHMEDFAKWGLPILRKMTGNQIVFELDKNLPKDKVLYKVIPLAKK